MAKHGERNPEAQEAKRQQRIAELQARRQIREEEQKKKLMEEEARKKKVSVDAFTFTQICKFGFLSDITPNGRVEITFTRTDIENMLRGQMVEKTYYSQVYNFLMLAMDRIQKHQILKNSPLYWQLAESV